MSNTQGDYDRATELDRLERRCKQFDEIPADYAGKLRAQCPTKTAERGTLHIFAHV